MESMFNEKTSLKAKSFVVDGSKKGRPKKRWKEVVEKDMLVRGFDALMHKTALYGGLAAKTGLLLLAG